MPIIETISLINVGTWLIKKIAGKGFDSFYGKLSANKLNKKFYNRVEIVSKNIQKKYPNVLGSSIEHFFKGQEVFDQLLKLLFKNSKVDVNIVSDSFDTSSLPANFIVDFVEELHNELRKDIEFDKILSDNEVYVAIQGLNQNVSKITKNSNLTLEEVSEIKAMLESKLGNSFLLEDFIAKYKKTALNNLTQVNFIGLSIDSSIKKKRKSLEDVFVKPNFNQSEQISLNKTNIEDESIFGYNEKSISLSGIFDNQEQLVVLGDPGSGKSVLIKFIIISILNKLEDEFNNQDIIKSIPFRIELRKYLSYKKVNGGNITKYLCFLLEDEYGIHGITEKIVDNIFKQNSCSIFFDGLDEIFKVEDKISIKNDIENFHSIYQGIKSITTSRKIGYEEAKLDELKFDILSVLSFDDLQVEEYANKWYSKEEQNTGIRKKEVDGFLSKRGQIDPELINNPLLLSLIVILYRNTLKLPESKLEIYQSCTKTLVDKWESSKELEIHLKSETYSNKEKILADLAYWQYLELSADNVDITYDKARNTVSNTIKDKLQLADEFTCIDCAEEFMLYAQKRSIYFDNNFTHKTFLEYYTAYWIYSNIEKKHKTDDRDQLISKYIANSFWHIVIELLLNMIDKDQADNEIMDDLLNRQMNESIDCLPFILSSINNYRNVSQVVVKRSIYLTIEKLITDAPNRTRSKDKNEEEMDGFVRTESKLFRTLMSLIAINETYEELALSCFKKIDKNSTQNSRYYLYTLFLELFRSPSMRFKEYDVPFDKSIFTKYIYESPYLYRLNVKNVDNTTSYDIVYIKKFIELFGVNTVFEEFKSIYDEFLFFSILEVFFMFQFMNNQTDNYYKDLNELEKIGLNKDKILKYFLTEKHIIIPIRDVSHLETIIALYSPDEHETSNNILFILFINIIDGILHDFKENIILISKIQEPKFKKFFLESEPLLKRNSNKRLKKTYDYVVNKYLN